MVSKLINNPLATHMKITRGVAITRFRLMLCIVYFAQFSLSVYASDVSESHEASVAAQIKIFVGQSASPSDRCAVLVHGLARSSASMNVLSKALNEAGWHTVNIDYPSREYPIASLAPAVFKAGVNACQKLGAQQIDGVAHSLGGILFRYFTETQSIDNFGRFVMLGTPNHGSEVVDNLRDVPGFVALNGPAGLEMGTDPDSIPNTLGEASYDTAVIAGTSSINLLLSNFLPNPDDGKVSVQSARLEGMCAMLTVAVSHPFLMKDESVILNTIAYLSNGKFHPASEENSEYPNCSFRSN